jgi:acetyltransferase
LDCALNDPAFDQFIVRSGAGPDVGLWADRFIETANKTDKPIIVNWASIPTRDADVREKIEKAGFLCVNYANRAARAAGVFTDFALKRQQFLQDAKNVAERPVPFCDLNLENATGTLSERSSKHCLAKYGIFATKEVLLELHQVAALNECPVPFPVAVKVMSADIPHKTEAGAVRLNITSLNDLKAAAAAVTADALRHVPGARIEGISIQEMATGLELIVGAVNDQFFGPYVMVGLGGILTEVLGDVAHRFAPLTLAGARDMLNELKGVKLFAGYRGSPPADMSAVEQTLVRLSWLISDHRATIAEIDINPLFVKPMGCGAVAADALIVANSLQGG